MFEKLFGPPNIEKLKQKGDVKALVKALGHDDRDIARKAAGALADLGDARAVEPLIVALKNPRGHVDELAAQILGELGDPRAVDPLIAAVEDKYYGLRKAAAGALGKLGDPRAVEPLIAALKDKYSAVRGEAASALGELGDVRAVKPLVAALEPGSPVREAAAEALVKLGEAAVESLIAALKHEYLKFGEKPEEMDWDEFRARYRVVEPQIAAAKALAELGDPRAVEPLIAALKDQNADVRQAAAAALERIGGPEAERALAEYRARQK